MIASVPDSVKSQHPSNQANSGNTNFHHSSGNNTQNSATSNSSASPTYQRTNSYVARQRAQSSYLPIHEETSYEIQAGTLDKNRKKNENLNNNNNKNHHRVGMVKSATLEGIGSYDNAQVYL